MKELLSMFSTALAIIAFLAFPCMGDSGSSPFIPGKEKKGLSIDREHLVFAVDKKELAMRINRFELAYINEQLKDPAKFVSRLSMKAPKVNAQKVMKVMKERRKELNQQLRTHVKQKSNEKKGKNNYPTLILRPYPPPPPGNTPTGIMASDSIEDALQELGLVTKDAIKHAIPCETRKGWITEPGHFAMGEMEDGCVSPSTCEGAVNYSLEDGVLPFYGELHNDQGQMIYYYFYGQLGYKFPAPLCDSWLKWEFTLGAGAGLFSDADSSWLYLDCFTFEMEDAYADLPDLPFHVVLAGSVLEINDNTARKSTTPQKFSGRINVKARTESALFVGLFVLIAASPGETITSGHFQIYNTLGGFYPGVKYRLCPHEPPM